jgi:hypothetical protein
MNPEKTDTKVGHSRLTERELVHGFEELETLYFRFDVGFEFRNVEWSAVREREEPRLSERGIRSEMERG